MEVIFLNSYCSPTRNHFLYTCFVAELSGFAFAAGLLHSLLLTDGHVQLRVMAHATGCGCVDGRLSRWYWMRQVHRLLQSVTELPQNRVSQMPDRSGVTTIECWTLPSSTSFSFSRSTLTACCKHPHR